MSQEGHFCAAPELKCRPSNTQDKITKPPAAEADKPQQQHCRAHMVEQPPQNGVNPWHSPRCAHRGLGGRSPVSPAVSPCRDPRCLLHSGDTGTARGLLRQDVRGLSAAATAGPSSLCHTAQWGCHEGRSPQGIAPSAACVNRPLTYSGLEEIGDPEGGRAQNPDLP